MSKVVFLTNVDRRFAMMKVAMQNLQEENLLSNASCCIKISDTTMWNSQWDTIFEDADIFLLKWMGASTDTPFLKKVLQIIKRKNIAHYIDAAGADEDEIVSGIKAKDLEQLKEYALYSGMKNYRNMLLYANGINSGSLSIEKPDPMNWSGIFHPRAKKIYTKFEDYKKDFCKPNLPNIGILFYRDEWVWGDLTYQSTLIEEIEKQGMNPVCVFSNGMPITEIGMPDLITVFRDCYFENGIVAIDALINIMKFSLTGSRSMTVGFLKEFNVPILQAYTLLTEYENWVDNLEGMNAMEVSISVTMPEFDGVIHSVPIANKKILTNGDVKYLPITERITRVVSKARKWANLRKKSNADKKIAIIFHNYPPRNSNIGSAVGLDTIESIRLVLEAMRERGYKIDAVPTDGKAFINELTSSATNDRALLSDNQVQEASKLEGKAYETFFQKLPIKVQEQLIKDWGPAPGEVMNYDGNLLLPGIMNGNVFITVQPPRGFGEDPSKIYHSPFSAPTHHYLGYYHWLREIWKADAVVHVGTHGSLEWLPGKNAGLANTCYPDIALGDLPNLYPYLITITGEGIQAKRRGAACLIEHLPPPMTDAGVYDELEELEKIMEEYCHFEKNQPENLEKLETMILEKVAQANLENEVIYNDEKIFSDYVLELHNYITDLKNMEVRIGLHILGEPPKNENMREYLLLLTRLENGDIPSLMQVLARQHNFDYYHLLENSSLIYEPLNITYGALIDKLRERSREIINILMNNNFLKDNFEVLEKLSWVADSNQEFKIRLREIYNYICETIHPNLLLTSDEKRNLLCGLEGEYIEPGPSGAPSSGGADLLPTGRNFYGVDPRNLPTPAAWEIGKTLGEQVIERYIAEEGSYPESVGIVLWSGSNMRSHGQCLAEFLYLLGVKPQWQHGSQRVIGLEVIPLMELKRPRIDVTARISGLFRDTMPSVMNLLDKAVLLVGELDEESDQNYVRKHLLADTLELEAEGLTKEAAWRQAAFRIFGDEQGVYGAGVAALLEAKNWENIDDIADVYVRWGAHAYGGQTKGEFLPQQFRKRMGNLDVTIKNEDNHETNMLSSDDYNAYHGGMIAAVRSIKGVAPRSYCGDSTDKSKVVMHSVQEEAKRIFRSEAINPKFIEGMMKHGYKGAADLANYIAHSFQWDATSDVMEDWMYEKYAEKYAFDPKVQEWLREVNPWALQRMAEILLEADQRGLWDAKEETKSELQKIYLSVEGELEERNE